MTFPEKECKFCTDMFTPFRRNQAFCSTRCRDLWWARHWKTEPHRCPQCGAFHAPELVLAT